MTIRPIIALTLAILSCRAEIVFNTNITELLFSNYFVSEKSNMKITNLRLIDDNSEKSLKFLI